MVMMHPPGSRPGMSSLAMAPAMRPSTIQLMMPAVSFLPLRLTHWFWIMAGIALIANPTAPDVIPGGCSGHPRAFR
jgi:hypothetical protein